MSIIYHIHKVLASHGEAVAKQLHTICPACGDKHVPRRPPTLEQRRQPVSHRWHRQRREMHPIQAQICRTGVSWGQFSCGVGQKDTQTPHLPTQLRAVAVE